MKKRRTVIAATLLVVGMGGVAVGSAVGAGTGKEPAPLTRVQRYWPAGPSAEYSGDSGGIGQVNPLTFTVPDGATSYDAVIEVSFQYVANGTGPWNAGVRLSLVGDVDRLPVRPAKLSLAKTAKNRPTSTTVRFIANDLDAGTTYQLAPSVNSAFGDYSVIKTSRVVGTVELTPSA